MSSTVLNMRGRRSDRREPANGNLPPKRRRNAEVRSREYLTSDDVDKLITAAKNIGRHGHRDATLILIAYRHGLRVPECRSAAVPV
jgi:integrase